MSVWRDRTLCHYPLELAFVTPNGIRAMQVLDFLRTLV